MTHPAEQVTKSFEHGEILYLTCPSRRGGDYLVAVAYNKQLNTIFVGHDCPAIQRGSNCWHVRAAENAFKEWRWWEVPEDAKVRSIRRTDLKFLPEFKQIPVPGQPLNIPGIGGMTDGSAKHDTA